MFLKGNLIYIHFFKFLLLSRLFSAYATDYIYKCYTILKSEIKWFSGIKMQNLIIASWSIFLSFSLSLMKPEC